MQRPALASGPKPPAPDHDSSGRNVLPPPPHKAEDMDHGSDQRRTEREKNCSDSKSKRSHPEKDHVRDRDRTTHKRSSDRDRNRDIPRVDGDGSRGGKRDRERHTDAHYERDHKERGRGSDRYGDRSGNSDRKRGREGDRKRDRERDRRDPEDESDDRRRRKEGRHSSRSGQGVGQPMKSLEDGEVEDGSGGKGGRDLSPASRAARREQRREKKKRDKERSRMERSSEIALPSSADYNAGLTADDIQMMQHLGLPFGFNTTQGAVVEDAAANESAVSITSQRKARQFMNRKGGFNRPLPAEKTGKKMQEV